MKPAQATVDQARPLRSEFASQTYAAHLLKEMYADERNRAYLLFLEPILVEMRRINKLFQGEDVDPLGIFEELQKRFKRLLCRTLKSCVLRHHDDSSLLTLDTKDIESIFLAIHDADLGSSFLEHLQGMRLSPEDGAPLSLKHAHSTCRNAFQAQRH
ncbi:hypothetical protein HPB48_026484 [Haemaphysalis longicornis]|uniref:Uncharacterized protein n=1 Tax=Haemaphysalis longicornis TaxID=44386 RepID=A0A9J6H9V2_HAELO|nr:hypothetical protein HPB48_026484 [Haemaphysalis longicornis]